MLLLVRKYCRLSWSRWQFQAVNNNYYHYQEHIKLLLVIGTKGFLFLALCMLPVTVYVLGWYKTDYKRTERERQKEKEMTEGEQEPALLSENSQ